MRLLFLIFILTASTVWANNQATPTPPTDQSDAFHHSSFGSGEENIQAQQREEEAPPAWVIPEESEIPEKQEEEQRPTDRVNEWQEQSQRATQGE